MRICLLLGIFAACMLAEESGPSRPSSSERSLRQDRHEGLTVSADPYSSGDRAKQKFSKANPLAEGILPIEVILRNETTQAIRIGLETIKLTVKPQEGKQQDIDALSVDEVAAAIAHPGGVATPHARRLPIGIPSNNDKKTDKLLEILRPLSLDADVVPPMSEIHGFLFFDLNHQMSLVDSASLYIPDVTRIPSKQALIFFEVPLGAQPR
jgi:hypothetical protein